MTGPIPKLLSRLADPGHVASVIHDQSRKRVHMGGAGGNVKMPAIEYATAFDPKSFLAKIGDGRSIHRYGKGQIIFSQGDTTDAVYYLQRGKLKVTVVSDQGKEAVTAILGADEFFGEGCLVDQAHHLSTVASMTESVVTRVSRAVFAQMISQESTFSDMFIAHILDRTLRVEADLVDQLFNSSERRLARLLLLLANFGDEAGPKPVIAKISQETLAEMIGTTRSRVSFFMNKFRKLGFIDYKGRIEVHRSLLNFLLQDLPR